MSTLNKKLLIYRTLILLLFSCEANASNNIKAKLIQNEQDKLENFSKIDKDDLKKVIKNSLQYIKDNSAEITPYINESGFYRINIQLPTELTQKFNISRVRLNYWPEDSSLKVVEESIHSHPEYFESYIIEGGYVHKIYILDETNSPNKQKLADYEIKKQEGANKTYNNLGQVTVAKVLSEKVSQGDLIVIEKNIIHKLSYSVPGTLSLNIIYNDGNDKSTYHVYLSDTGKDADIVTSRASVKNPLKHKIIKEIEARIQNYIFQTN